MSEIGQKIDAALAELDEGWTDLLATTKSGQWFKNGGQTAPGRWLDAKRANGRARALLAEAKAIADAPPPAPDPEPVPDPTPPPSPKPSWGFSAHALTPKLGATIDTYVPRLKAAGSKMMRDDVYPGSAQATYDRLLHLAADNGQKLVLILNGGAAPPPPSTVQAFAKTLVGYGKANFPGVLHAIEPANEPNLNATLRDPAVYVTHHNAAYAGVKEADPGVLVWGAACSGDGTAFARDTITRGLKFDEWSCHPYPAFGFFADAAGMLRTDIESGWAQVFWRPEKTTGKTLAGMLHALGYDGFIHATEWGIPTIPPGGWASPPTGSALQCSPESVQADVWRLGYPVWRREPQGGWLLDYTGQDDDTDRTDSREPHFGAHRSNGTPKPIVAVMQATV